MATKYYSITGLGTSSYDSTSGSDITVSSLTTQILTPTWTLSDTSGRLSGLGASTGYWYGSVTLGSGSSVNIVHVTPPAYPGNSTWSTSGTESVQMALGTADVDLDIRVRILQVNSSGTVQATGSWTSYQTMSATRTFTPSKPTWSSPAVTDRYALEIEYVDTRSHGGGSVYQVKFNEGDTNDSDSCFLATEVDGPESGQYAGVYYLTNDTSDLSTYTDGNYVMNSTGESASSTITFTNVADTASKTIGFITPSGDPGSTSWTNDTEHQVFIIEYACYNDSSPAVNLGGAFIYAQLERLNSSGTVQESATTYDTDGYGVWNTDDTSADFQMIGLSIPNKSWTSPASGDRLAVKIVITNESGEDADLAIRVHNGTSQTGLFYSKTFASGGTLYNENHSMTATGTAAFSKVFTANRSLSYSATGTAAESKTVSLFKTFSATGTAAFSRVMAAVRSFSFTGTGTSTFAKALTFPISAAMTATGTAAKSITVNLFKTFTGTGTSAFSKALTLAKSFSFTGTGTAALTKTKTILQSLSYTAIGTLTFSKGLAYNIAATMTATGTAAFSRVMTAVRSFSYSGVGTSVLTKLHYYTRGFNYAVTGTPTFSRVKTAFRSFSYGATGTLSLVKGLVYDISATMTAIGSPALSTAITILVANAYTAIGTAALTKNNIWARLFSFTGVGTADKGTMTVGLPNTFSATGAASSSMVATYSRAFSYSATGSLSTTVGIVALESHSYSATGTVGFSKNVIYTAAPADDSIDEPIAVDIAQPIANAIVNPYENEV